jgi:hypothetical protein
VIGNEPDKRVLVSPFGYATLVHVAVFVAITMQSSIQSEGNQQPRTT